MAETAPTQDATFGWIGFAVGAAALVLTLVTFWAGPFAPQQAAGVTLGELAADIAKAAARSVAGQEQPPPVAVPWTIDKYLEIAVGVLSGFAILIGVAAFVRHEQKRAAMSGIALGGLAMAVQFFAWTIGMIVGGLVLVGVLYALRDTFGGMFGGLLGD